MIVSKGQHDILVDPTVNSECKDQTYIWRYRNRYSKQFIVFPAEYYGHGKQRTLKVPSTYLPIGEYEFQVEMFS